MNVIINLNKKKNQLSEHHFGHYTLMYPKEKFGNCTPPPH